MKGFLEDIYKMTGLPQDAVNYRCIMMGGKSVFIDGIKCIKSYREGEVIVAFKKGGGLVVTGSDLNITHLNSHEIQIAGVIEKVERI